MKWNAQQQRAIEEKTDNVLVSAAAGSGKTAVLVERLVRRILDPEDAADLEKVLVVTFTEAAAGEMRQRIGAALQHALRERPDDRYLKRQLNLLNKAHISTIHSFCHQLVRKFFYLVDVEPNFRVGDANEVTLLRAEVMDALFEDHYRAGEEQFLKLVAAYGGVQDSNLKGLLFALYDYAHSQPNPLAWLEETAAVFPDDAAGVEGCNWFAEIKEDTVLGLEEVKWYLERCLVVCDRPGGPHQYLEPLAQDIEAVSSMVARITALSWEQLWSVMNADPFTPRLPGARGADESLKEEAKALRNAAKNRYRKLRSEYFSRSPQQHLEDMARVYPLIQQITMLVKEFSVRFAGAKREKNMLDFTDLEQMAYRLLHDDQGRPSAAAAQLQQQFEEVMVDEYQDVNVIQNAILEAAARQDRGGYLFMVGDVKQSIYRFRLAEPGLFMEKERRFGSKPASGGTLIPLNTNYRSRRNVIAGVNFLFQQLLDYAVGEVDYGSEHQSTGHFLKYGGLYPEHAEAEADPALPVEMHLLERETGEEGLAGDEEWLTLEVLEKEALVIARRIKQLVEGQEGEEGQGPARVWDTALDRYRPLKYRDIAVLLRSTRYRAARLADVLNKFDIPVYTETGSGYFSAPEVEAMLSLLQVIDNPLQDIPLAAVLRSPLVGLKGEELAEIRTADRAGDYYHALVKAADTLSAEETKGKIQHFLQCLDRWRTLSRQEPLSHLIWEIYRDTGFVEYAAGLPGGQQREANLRALYDRARRFDSFIFQGLFRFLRYIERLREAAGDLGSARALGENEDVVRIFSIHKSKGLEFPVVIVADMGKKFNTEDLKGDMLFHQRVGIGLKAVDKGLGLRFPTLPQLAVRRRLRMENLAEEMRVLYVALTRARERLIMVGSVRQMDKWLANLQLLCQCGETVLPAFYRAGAASYLDWVCGALIRHRDGERMAAGHQIPADNLYRHHSCWSINCWYPQDLIQLGAGAQADGGGREDWEKIRQGKPLVEQFSIDARLKDKMQWVYPKRKLQDRAAKLSVSELKRRLVQGEGEKPAVHLFGDTVGRRPLFVQEAGLTAAERGIAVHLVMQHLDLGRPVDNEHVQNQIDGMVLQELLTPEQAAVVPVGEILSFFRTAAGQRMLEAPHRVVRELAFSLRMPAAAVYQELNQEEYGNTEKVLVQGVIDCFIKEATGLTLVDYKTDRVEPGRQKDVVQKYRLQLSLYARALTALYGQKVERQYLYLFDAKELISL